MYVRYIYIHMQVHKRWFMLHWLVSEATSGCLLPQGKNSQKINTLLNFEYKMSMDLTFENIYKNAMSTRRAKHEHAQRRSNSTARTFRPWLTRYCNTRTATHTATLQYIPRTLTIAPTAPQHCNTRCNANHAPKPASSRARISRLQPTQHCNTHCNAHCNTAARTTNRTIAQASAQTSTLQHMLQH